MAVNKLNKTIEYRQAEGDFEIGDEGAIEGYAAVFDQWSDDLGWFKEKIRPGAFTNTLKIADVRALFNHDPNYVLGRNRAETLDLVEDDHGLHFRAEPPATQWADDLRTSIGRGDINQGSFGFYIVREEWQEQESERELIEVELMDVSVVTYPAYPQTTISARALTSRIKLLLDRLDHDNLRPEIRENLTDQLNSLLAGDPSQAAGDLEDGQAAELQAWHRGKRREILEALLKTER